MYDLTYGERYIRWLTGGDADRAPFSWHIGWMPWGQTYDRWKKETGNYNLDIPNYVGFEPTCAIPKHALGLLPVYTHSILNETDEFITYRNEQGIIKRDRKDHGSMPEFLDYPVKKPVDWDNIKRTRFKIGDPERLTEDWDSFKQRLKQTGEAVQVGYYPYGIFGAPRDLLGVEGFLLGFYEYPDMIKDIMNHLTTLWITVWDQISEHVSIDHIHIWEDMASRQGSLISPTMVEEFMMPCYDRIVEFADAKQIRMVSVDTDGQVCDLARIMHQHGINMMFPFEVQAGNDIREYRQTYPNLGIVGGLDKRCLAQSRDAIDRELQKVPVMLRKRRYVAEFDHLIPPDVPWELYQYAASQIKSMVFEKY